MPRTLPSFTKMWNNYPLGNSIQVKAKIGGKVNYGWITNTCTIRLSRALNYSGDPIPPSGPSLNSVSGDDGKWYAYRVKEIEKYLTRRYGAPTVDITGNSKETKASVLGKKGIIIFVVNGWTDATGHIDMWNGSAIRYSEYFNKAQTVKLWVCP